MKTEQQIKNLKDALHNMWPSVPEANVVEELQCWQQDTPDNSECDCSKISCSTIACFGGWCAHWPSFKSQGVFVGILGEPELYCGVRLQLIRGTHVAKVLFGDGSLFEQRGWHPADEGFDGSDHALVTNRLKWALAHKESTE